MTLQATLSHTKTNIETKDDNSILKEALQLCGKLAQDNNNNNRLWMNKYRKLVKTVTHTLTNSMPLKKRKKITANNLKSHYDKFWLEKINSESKMRTYRNLKTNFGIEDYLVNTKDYKQRKSLTKLRISAHTLAIERGRYSRPPIPANQRKCTACSDNSIEDEYHFLAICKKYEIHRKRLYEEISKLCKHFNDLGNWDKFIFMLTADGDISRAVSTFIHKNLP